YGRQRQEQTCRSRRSKGDFRECRPAHQVRRRLDEDVSALWPQFQTRRCGGHKILARGLRFFIKATEETKTYVRTAIGGGHYSIELPQCARTISYQSRRRDLSQADQK